jgi:hypothetical protein
MLTLALQKIRTTAYSSFSVFGLCFIFVTGGTIILTSYALSPILSILQRRRQFKSAATLEWCVNETLQLQRLAHEELGCGTWSNAAGSVPITLAGERLACLDLTNLAHPKLAVPTTKSEMSTVGSSQQEQGSEDGPAEETQEVQEIPDRRMMEQPSTESSANTLKKPAVLSTVTDLDGRSSRRNSA